MLSPMTSADGPDAACPDAAGAEPGASGRPALRVDAEPWSPVLFGQLDDQLPYLFTGGRITLRTSS